ncbi:Ferrochelatase [Cocos nucifera]|uniref:Ferrochelatase n=1 Tax=Cocos nucifera TaxID=13894 RepID=A0A8K0I9S1_COCNU|nr:Ferrochelatase [Cocos nucifera]
MTFSTPGTVASWLPHRMRAFTCNAISSFHYLPEDSQRSKQPLEIVSVSHHASADSSGNLTESPIKNRHLVGKAFFSNKACAFDEKILGMPLGIAQERVGVLLLNLGGPETLHDVQPFLFNLFADPIKMDNITKLVILPLYPQFSISTSGSSLRLLQSIFRKDAYFARLPVSIIESWYQREGYIKSMADLMEKELLGFSKPEEVMIFFSAHGVPRSYVEDAGDPYKDHMEECIALIMDELKSKGIANDHTLAYQSRVGPVQWLKPYTDEVIVDLGQKGVKSLMVVPISFVSEHIETLEEIDMEYRHLALQSGIENWGRVPALGCTSSFISDLADAVIEALPFASTMSSAKDTSKDADMDPLQYAIKMFFGSILAFILLLSPKLFSVLKNSVI